MKFFNCIVCNTIYNLLKYKMENSMINSGNGYKNVWRPWPLHLGIGYAQLCEHAIKFVYTRQNLLCMQVLELNIDSM